jgi:hypothetical protein
MRCCLVLAWFCALGVTAADNKQLAPEVATLAKIKARMSQTLTRQPNYTCVQQVERSHRRLPKGRYELHDLIRIEVALVDGKEMYAWPGSRKFEDTDLSTMVTGGAIGTGNFATHARAVFQTSSPQFRHIGRAEIDGREVIRYDFVVPMLTSGYRIRVKEQEAVVGYHGSFWADAESYELVRLEIIADNIPPSLGVVSAQDAMEYSRVKIGAGEFLLPKYSELVMADLYGNESRNRTVFTACKQYSGESVLTFAEAPQDEPEAPSERVEEVAKENIQLPGDLSFDVKMLTEIDSATAAVGDPVAAILDDNIKVKRRIIANKGATLLGRILRLERHGDFTVLDLQFSELDSERTHGILSASIDAAVDLSQKMTMQRAGLDLRRRMASFNGLKFRGARFRLRVGDRVPVRTHTITMESLTRTVYQ